MTTTAPEDVAPASEQPPRAGLFVVFEGPEGAGKSTQLRLLADRLGSLGRQFLLTREPGGTKAGDALRAVLLDPDQSIAPVTEFLLYSASRAQLVTEVIAPALAAGRDVLSDRFTGASVAYQGYGRGLDLEFIDAINRGVTGGLTPDLTVLLDIDPVTGLRRVAARAGLDRLEAESIDFHSNVRAGFAAQARSDPSWLVVDGAGDEAEVAAAIWAGVEDLLARRREPAR